MTAVSGEALGRVLVVDDERSIRRYLRAVLADQGYEVIEAERGEVAIAAAARHRPDVVLLDLGLPDIDGLVVIERLREFTAVPIIVLSVREHEDDKVAALDAGADDYLTKPFGTSELLARLRAAARRATAPAAVPVLALGGLRMDLARHHVTVDDVEVQLTPTEYDLLRALLQDAGKVLTHRQLLRRVWGPGYETDTHLLRVNVSNLRRKIEADPTRPRYVLTEPGVGYRLGEA
jgi:two-component system, OmpR family, KDP operon response regulator KdpE